MCKYSSWTLRPDVWQTAHTQFVLLIFAELTNYLTLKHYTTSAPVTRFYMWMFHWDEMKTWRSWCHTSALLNRCLHCCHWKLTDRLVHTYYNVIRFNCSLTEGVGLFPPTLTRWTLPIRMEVAPSSRTIKHLHTSYFSWLSRWGNPRICVGKILRSQSFLLTAPTDFLSVWIVLHLLI